MDFENNEPMDQDQPQPTPEPNPQPNAIPPSSPQTPPAPQTIYVERPVEKKTNGFLKVVSRILFGLSILCNIVLFMAVIGLGALIAASQDGFLERTLIDSDSINKIAVIRLEGVINNEMSGEVQLQLKKAQEDPTVQAVIMRIISPGGGVAASDQIHHAISQYRKDTNKPVLAFFQTVAASGGYYSAVACDQIVSEPTAITGSIGVIMNHLVIKEMLEEKLGISPVVVKSGPKKDWPSMFSDTTDEQKEYLNDKLIAPAYNRFVSLVAQGRQDVLDIETVRHLADGSIYGAQEALDNKLIDGIGYFDTAVEQTLKLAGISDAKVVEYQRPLTFMDTLTAKSNLGMTIDTESIQQMLIPQLQYLWDGRN